MYPPPRSSARNVELPNVEHLHAYIVGGVGVVVGVAVAVVVLVAVVATDRNSFPGRSVRRFCESRPMNFLGTSSMRALTKA